VKPLYNADVNHACLMGIYEAAAVKREFSYYDWMLTTNFSYNSMESKEKEGAFMSIATITSKGQTTIPKDIRDCLQLEPKDQIQFTIVSDKTVIMRVKKRSINELYGLLHEPDKVAISVESMKSWR
jgi:antitoxin PrlF